MSNYIEPLAIFDMSTMSAEDSLIESIRLMGRFILDPFYRVSDDASAWIDDAADILTRHCDGEYIDPEELAWMYDAGRDALYDGTGLVADTFDGQYFAIGSEEYWNQSEH